jgi:excinuclease ABC subunit A
VNILLELLHKLVEKKNSVVVIEHNLDVIKTADWLIDLGPEGGKGGGRIIAEGVPESVAQSRTETGSFTGLYLYEELERDRKYAQTAITRAETHRPYEPIMENEEEAPKVKRTVKPKADKTATEEKTASKPKAVKSGESKTKAAKSKAATSKVVKPKAPEPKTAKPKKSKSTPST